MSPRRSALRTAPASYAQRLLWLIERRAAGGLNDRLAWRVTGPLDHTALGDALAMLERRHEAVRTSFATERRTLVQHVHPPGRLAIQGSASVGEPWSVVSPVDESLIDEIAARPVDPAGPPLAVHVWRHGPDHHTLLLVVHQLVTDPRSTEILAHELGVAYELARGACAAPLPTIGWQYADWCEWQQARLAGERLRALQAWWRSELADAELPTLPVRGDGTPGAKRYARRRLPGAVAPAVRRLAAAHGTSPFVVALAAFQASLYDLTGRPRVTVAGLHANRRPEVEHTVGPFVNMVVLRGRVDPGSSIGERLAATADAVARANAHAELPFQLLPPGALADPSGRVADVVFQFREGDPRASALTRIAGLELEPVERQPDRARFAVELFVALLDDDVAAVVLYDSGRVPDAWAAALADRFCVQLGAMARVAATSGGHAAAQATAISS